MLMFCPILLKGKLILGVTKIYRGEDGPLKIHRPAPKDPISLAFLKSGKEKNYQITNDIKWVLPRGVWCF
jgi:Choline dehydrogenase and related flavoproteins